MKKCSKCKVEKELKDFNICKSNNDGYYSICKQCRKDFYEKNKNNITQKNRECHKKNRKERLIKQKKYYNENKESILKKQKIDRMNKSDIIKNRQLIYYAIIDNKEKKKKNDKVWRENNEEKIRKTKQIYYKKNKSKIQAQNRIKDKDRYKNNINYRIARILRKRMNEAIKNNYKSGSAVKDLGCSIEYFVKEYMPSKFQEGMTWDNYGLYGWHIDHIIPLSSFDLTDRGQLLKACHYSNLQPLWAEDNLRKGSKS